MFQNIPDELKLYRQWVCWRFEDLEAFKPSKVPYNPNSHRRADPTNSHTWATYEEAIAAAENEALKYNGIGFVLSDNDPYTIIDLDDPYEIAENGTPKHTNPDDIMQRQLAVFNEFDSYSELSQSGKGLHIIMKGAVPSGRRRSAIEIYSTQRFMIMTGRVYKAVPIQERNEMLNGLWQQMSEGKSAQLFYAGLENAKLSNEQVLQMAGTAKNADKFNDLFYEGNFQKYYPSQSEADFALVDMLAFYSENRLQVQNLFLQSALGQREKSRAQYRINYMLDRCFDRMLPPVDIDGLRNQMLAAVAKANANTGLPDTKPASVTSFSAIISEPSIPSPQESEKSPYSVPPGLIGDIAQFLYAQAPRPVPEIALAGALGLVAGIVGRSYNISNTGLNQYILLLAPTGTGKEAIASGIDKLMHQVLKTVPAGGDFIGPAEISSPQALTKYMAAGKNSFVTIAGEFGLRLQEISAPNAPAHLSGLRRMLLDLYNKSGEGKLMRPTIYSDKSNNTLNVLAPAFTLLGESTPERFYQSLSEDMISEGLLPRFTTIEYRGIRPPLNEAHSRAQPSFSLIERLSTLCAQSLMLNSQNKAIHVGMTDGAKAKLDGFNMQCDFNINDTSKDVCKQLWNRAHMKALKMGAVIAVGINPMNPIIDEENAEWAIRLIIADVNNMLTRFDAGEIGASNDETTQLTKVIGVVREYMILGWDACKGYSPNGVQLHSDKIVPFSYISRRLSAVGIFKKDRRGSARALEVTIKTLLDRGDIREMSRADMMKYNTTAKCYMVAVASVFNL